MDLINMRNWGFDFPETPIIISGPCSAETREQVLETCSNLPKNKVHILRAGIWKPRTRPNSFEGVGAEALSWIKEAARICKLPVCVEVANAAHVKMALDANIDILWIGARTTVNPFAVQEIADALKGKDIPVLVKNPVNPDIELWIGALERLYQAGIHKLAVIHRGFSVPQSEPYRNRPKWEIPIEFRRRLPNVEIICDPSHICGRRDLLLKVAQKSLDLNFDGLMIESHINPDEAWSDAKQQVTPKALDELLGNLVHRTASSDNPIFLNKLEKLRNEIDELDAELIDVLYRRMEKVKRVGEYKKENAITILQIERWIEIFETRTRATLNKGMSKHFAADFLEAIHKESIRQQMAIMNDKIEKTV